VFNFKKRWRRRTDKDTSREQDILNADSVALSDFTDPKPLIHVQKQHPHCAKTNQRITFLGCDDLLRLHLYPHHRRSASSQAPTVGASSLSTVTTSSFHMLLFPCFFLRQIQYHFHRRLLRLLQTWIRKPHKRRKLKLPPIGEPSRVSKRPRQNMEHAGIAYGTTIGPSVRPSFPRSLPKG